MEQYITLASVLHHIDSGQPFEIVVVNCDLARGSGGELRTYRHCVKYVSQVMPQKEAAKAASLSHPKRPHHWQNGTKNIFLTHEREVRKIHNRLIVRFNGKRVS